MHIFFNKKSVFGSFSVLGQLLFVWIVTLSVGWLTVSLIRRFTQNGARCSSRGWWLMRLVVKAQFSFPLCKIPIVQTFHVAVALRRFLCKQRFNLWCARGWSPACDRVIRSGTSSSAQTKIRVISKLHQVAVWVETCAVVLVRWWKNEEE